MGMTSKTGLKRTHSNAGLLALQKKLKSPEGLGLAAAAVSAPTAELLAVCDGIAVELEPDITSTEDKRVRARVHRILPGSWKLRDDSANSTDFRGFTALPPPEKVPDVSKTWELAQKLAEIKGIRSVVPLFAQVAPTVDEAATVDGLGAAALGAAAAEVPRDWHLATLNIPGAWTKLRQVRIEPGQGVTVAVVDTGYTRHPEIFDRLTKVAPGSQTVRGLDLLDGTDPLDPLEGGFILPNPSHGTSVMSVIVSPEGRQSDILPQDQFVTGIAPAAEVFPIRMTTSAVLLTPNKLTDAFREIAKPDSGIDMVNVSLGLPYTWGALRAAVQDVVNQGMIVVAAAGNYWPFVAFPGAYPEVLAVAAGMSDGRPWPWTCSGGPVDVLAPGDKITRARAIRQGGGQAPRYEVGPGSGTTFATACCSGLAALWLSRHGGRQALIDHYGGVASRVPQAFHLLLRKTAQPFEGTVLAGWFGAGVPHAPALLDADLPTITELEADVRALQSMAMSLADAQATPQVGFSMAETASAPALTVGEFEDLLAIGQPEQLDAITRQELHFHIASRPALLPTMSVMVAAGRAAALRSRLLEIPELSPKLRDLLKAAPERADQAQAAAKTRRGAEADQAKEESKLPNPPGRRLQVYAVDPSYAASIETSPYNRVTVNVRWEAVKPGPVGEYLEVVDIDPASGAAYPPIDLNDARLLARDGLAPSEGDPRFHQQMVYAVAMKTIKHFERALGRPAFWATEPYQDETGRWQPEPFNPRLRIYPHALRTQNAYYSPDKRALLFGYFPSPSLDGASGTPGPTVFTCLSYDIIAHETTHALLDGMYTHFIKPTNADVLAFHEAFADIVALFQHFTHPELLRAAIEQTRGDLEAESQLGKLAVQFGHATGQRGALRDAIGHITEDGKWVRHKPRADLLRTDRYRASAHARGSILVAAVFDAFLLIYKERAKPVIRLATAGSGVLPPGNLPVDLAAALAREAAKTAEQILNICIRALDYLPPLDVTFGEYLRAILTADRDLVPDDEYGYRVAFAQAFRSWGIQPAGVTAVAPDSLFWDEPGAASSLFELSPATRARLNQLLTEWRTTRDREALHKNSLDEKRKFHELLREYPKYHPGSMLGSDIGIDLEKPFEVHTLRPASSVGPDGETNPLVVVTLTQRKEDKESGETFRIGATILFGLGDGKIRYVIHRRDRRGKMGEAIRDYREFRLASAQEVDPYNIAAHQGEPFAALHLIGRY